MMVDFNRTLLNQTTPDILMEMFGTPPQFNIARYDRLWSLEKAEVIGSFENLMNRHREDPQRIIEAFRQVELTGNKNVDEWIRRIRQEQ